MRESEIAARLATLFDTGFRNEKARTLLGVPIADIARALGAPVEPDEPELPDRLHWSFDGLAWLYVGPTRESVVLGRGAAASAAVAAISVDGRPALKRYLDAAFAAYNERPRWEPGVPPSSEVKDWQVLCQDAAGVYVVIGGDTTLTYPPNQCVRWCRLPPAAR